jgi:hypothetical protein
MFRRELTDANIPIGSTNNQWGMIKTPLIEGSLYGARISKYRLKGLKEEPV